MCYRNCKYELRNGECRLNACAFQDEEGNDIDDERDYSDCIDPEDEYSGRLQDYLTWR